MIDLQTKLEVFSEFLDCSGLTLWHYDPQMHLLSSTAKDPEQLDVLMKVSGGTSVVKNYCQKNDRPGFYSDFASLVYLTSPRYVNGVLTDIYIIGPVFTSMYSENTLLQSLSGLGLSPQSNYNTIRLLKSVPVIQHTLLLQYGRMLHRCLNGTVPDLSDIQPITPKLHDKRRLLAASSRDDLEQTRRVSPYALEQQIFQAVEDGNVDYVHPDGLLQLTPGTLSKKDPLRSAKNEIIACITLITRAAIRGGMPEDSAYALSDYYICMLEESDNISEVYQFSQEAFRDFTERVHKYKISSGRSKEVQECISYLELNLDRKVSLRELAANVGYNGNYLSTKFSREMGMSISDYTIVLKMERAKVLLRNTNKPLQDICEELGLTSTSYFCSLFKKTTGITPMEYRNGAECKA